MEKSDDTNENEEKWLYNYTLSSEEKLMEKDLDPEFYQGRRIISRDTPIDKGVFMVLGIQEAIVVDLSKDKYIYEFYRTAEKEINKLNLKPLLKKTKIKLEEQILNIVFNIVKSKIEYSKEKTEQNLYRIKEKHKLNTITDVKVKLGYILKNGYGVCRHSCLVTGVIIEKLITEGYLKGNVSIDRNMSTEKGGHAWCRYTNDKGQTHILDTAQQENPVKLEDTINGYWNYHRPKEVTITRSEI